MFELPNAKIFTFINVYALTRIEEKLWNFAHTHTCVCEYITFKARKNCGIEYIIFKAMKHVCNFPCMYIVIF